MRVLDLSRVLAGPLCAQVLGDLGADVIKVESPAGDETRRLGKPGEEGSAPYFMGLNRNKKGIVLNFDNEADRTRLHALIEQSDVLIENFLQGSMARWGFDYETV
ncbi:MAG: CoA transferase, partial [Betaproteobacteria bacterium]|nr:CoA transferase [Betaproteobacteria bacterium]